MRRAGNQEQHVAVAQQPLGTHFIEHDSRVAAVGHLERDPRRQVALDQAGDDVDHGLLRGQDQVHADGAGELRQADDVLLDLLFGRHHDLGQLVGDDHDVRHVGRDALALFVVFGRSRV